MSLPDRRDAEQAKARLDAKAERIFAWLIAVAIVASVAVALIEVFVP